MKVLVAPAPFKESMSASDAADSWARQLTEAGLECIVQPLSDGGEGFLDVFVARGATTVEIATTDCLGRPITSPYALYNGSAIIEMAQASGLEQIAESDRDPFRASTRGTGEQIRHAMQHSPKRIITGLGGSATNDGGLGLFLELGGRVTDRTGRSIKRISDIGPDAFLDTSRLIDLDLLPEMIAATDVQNTLLGQEGATYVYGPQKGIPADRLEKMDNHMRRWADLIEAWRGSEFRNVPGSGAAGGLGFGLLACCNATVRSGFDMVSAITGLEEKVSGCDLVLTGEGRIDRQSGFGKAPRRIQEMSRRHGVPVAAIAGVIEAGSDTYDFSVSLSDLAGSGQESMRDVDKWMGTAIQTVLNEYIRG